MRKRAEIEQEFIDNLKCYQSETKIVGNVTAQEALRLIDSYKWKIDRLLDLIQNSYGIYEEFKMHFEDGHRLVKKVKENFNNG